MYKIINSNVLDFTSEQKYHAIISDPPYGLAFMGKQWDSFKKPVDYQKWVTEWSGTLLDFLYPGSVCAFFGGTRTYHRLASGLEDAGYEIFDSMIWCYGSGFPKSYNISKGIDKSLGLEREIVKEQHSFSGGFGNMSKVNKEQGYRPSDYYKESGNDFSITKPNSNLANTWNGYGTALKPAYEPIVLCRKPLEKGGYVYNALTYGTSGLNIDGSRIGTSDKLNGDGYQTKSSDGWDRPYRHDKNRKEELNNKKNERVALAESLGRFPANFGLICDCEKKPCECVESELDRQSGISKDGIAVNKNRNGEKPNSIYGKYQIHSNENVGFNSNGGASRFFYTAKASSKERDIGLNDFELVKAGGMQARNDGSLDGHITYRKNNHPTVKPIKLIEYLAKLLLPPIDNSSILIPFSGVGSEMIGCHLAGWNQITGIEIDEHYVEIANKRLEYWTQYDNYQDAISNKSLIDKLPSFE